MAAVAFTAAAEVDIVNSDWAGGLRAPALFLFKLEEPCLTIPS